jgi:SHS2 domain-containing protein
MRERQRANQYRSAQGHRTVPHTADVRIEAWAPTREACIAEAVSALVATFADTTAATPYEQIITEVTADSDPDLLVAALDEVIYILDTRGAVPCDTDLTPGPMGVEMRLEVVPVSAVELVGAVPKAVTLHDLRFEHCHGGWRCGVIVDV